MSGRRYELVYRSLSEPDLERLVSAANDFLGVLEQLELSEQELLEASHVIQELVGRLAHTSAVVRLNNNPTRQGYA